MVTSAERYIESLELFGMQFGLERMRALLDKLGHPERQFDAIHVVGSNGKSSTVRFAEALLEGEGIRTGAYLSPHLTTFRERIRIGGQTISEPAYERAVHDVMEAVGDGVTQFEALTAAALQAFAQAGVQWAVVEAGLGGRLDATNVLSRSRVQVLTNVSLEHSELLGDTREKIAAEKLAVVPGGGIVIAGEEGWDGLVPQARSVTVTSVGGSFQDQNRAVAEAAVEAALGRPVDASAAEPDHRARQVRDPRPRSARDLGRRAQPGRHAAAGRRAARRARRSPGGGGVLGAGGQGRRHDGVAAPHGVPDDRRHVVVEPAVAACGGDRAADRWRGVGRATGGSGGGPAARRQWWGGCRLRVAVPFARPGRAAGMTAGLCVPTGPARTLSGNFA